MSEDTLFWVWSPGVPVRPNPRVCSLAFEPLNVSHPFPLFSIINAQPHFPYITKMSTMSILDTCWKKSIPSPSALYEYEQQQYIFKKGTAQGLFNMHYNSQVECWMFPTFYRSYMGRLIYRRVLLIKLWSMHKRQTLTTLPNSTTVFKHLCQLVSFTDRVVETCLADVRGVMVSATWVPKILQEWLILEFNAGHGEIGRAHV